MTGSTGYRYIDGIDAVFGDVLQNVIPPADNRYAVNEPPPLIGIVIDDAYDSSTLLLRSARVTQNHLPRVPRTDQHDIVCAFFLVPVLARPEQKNEAVGKTCSYNQHEQQHGAHNVVGDRHTSVEHTAGSLHQHCQQGRCENPDQFIVAGKAPDAAVQIQGMEDDQAADSKDRRKVNEALQEFIRDH